MFVPDWLPKLGMSLFQKVSLSLPEFRHDVNPYADRDRKSFSRLLSHTCSHVNYLREWKEYPRMLVDRQHKQNICKLTQKRFFSCMVISLSKFR